MTSMSFCQPRSAPAAPYFRLALRHGSSKQWAHAHSHAAAIPREIAASVDASRDAWIKQCLGTPLTGLHNTQLHVLGVCSYAPRQWVGVEQLIKRLRPAVVALDLPAAESAASYPSWIDTLLGSSTFESLAFEGTSAAPSRQATQQLAKTLHLVGVPAKIGQDIVDQYETFGFYSASHLCSNPAQISHILEHHGFLPGAELAAAVKQGLAHDCRIISIGAPLRLQQHWVRGFLGDFSVREQDLASQLQKDFEADQRLLSNDLVQWDAAVAGVRYGTQEDMLAAYKVCKSVAAATLTPDQVTVVLDRQRRLQPLKALHFQKQSRHMAWQLEDVCRHRDLDRSGNEGAREHAATGSTSGQAVPGLTMLAVVGRQHWHDIAALWSDSRSILRRKVMA